MALGLGGATRGLYNTCIPPTASTWIINVTQVPRRLSGSEHLIQLKMSLLIAGSWAGWPLKVLSNLSYYSVIL